MKQRFNWTWVMIAAVVLLLPGCESLRTSTPGGTTLTHTATGAGAGALIGWAAGDAGKGAAIGAGVGLLGGVIEADRQAEEQRRAAYYRRTPMY